MMSEQKLVAAVELVIDAGIEKGQFPSRATVIDAFMVEWALDSMDDDFVTSFVAYAVGTIYDGLAESKTAQLLAHARELESYIEQRERETR